MRGKKILKDDSNTDHNSIEVGRKLLNKLSRGEGAPDVLEVSDSDLAQSEHDD